MALDDPTKTRFYIHVDQRSADFFGSPSLKPIMDKENVLFLRDRVKVYWGGFSIVEATLQLIRKAVDEGGFEYAVLLSGQDFPIKSNRHIEHFFESHNGKEFISHTPLPSQEWGWGPDIMEHIESYWRVDGVRRLLEMTGSKKLQSWGWSAYSRLTTLAYRYAPGLKRKFLPGIAPYGGPNWFAISSRCATHVLDYLQEHPEYCRFFVRALVPDELFLQTLILNSPFRDHVINDALRLTDWETGASSPRVLTGEDFDRLIASDSLYARKFDSTKYPDIISRIRSYIAVDI
jgi:hypothetical protein